MTLNTNVLQLLEEQEQGKIELRDYSISGPMIEKMKAQPEVWQDFFDKRTTLTFKSRADLTAFDNAFREATGLTHYQLRATVAAFKLYPLRPAKQQKREQVRNEYFQHRKDLAYTLSKYIRGVVTAEGAAKEAGISQRMVFRHALTMIQRVDPKLMTVSGLKNLTVAANRSLAERALIKELEFWDERQAEYVSEEERTKYGRA